MVAVIDDQDRVLYSKRLANDLSLIVAALATWRAELQGGVDGSGLPAVRFDVPGSS